MTLCDIVLFIYDECVLALVYETKGGIRVVSVTFTLNISVCNS